MAGKKKRDTDVGPILHPIFGPVDFQINPKSCPTWNPPCQTRRVIGLIRIGWYMGDTDPHGFRRPGVHPADPWAWRFLRAMGHLRPMWHVMHCVLSIPILSIYGKLFTISNSHSSTCPSNCFISYTIHVPYTSLCYRICIEPHQWSPTCWPQEPRHCSPTPGHDQVQPFLAAVQIQDMG